MNTEELTVELGGNDYYRVVCVISEIKNENKWLGMTRVTRKDTGEYINAGFTVYEDDKEAVINISRQRVNDLLLRNLEELGKPIDWNKEIKRILLRCKKLKTEIVEFGGYAEEVLSSRGNTDEYWDRYSIFWREIIKESIALCRSIEMLSEKERIEILELSEDAIKDPTDAWNLDELDAKTMIFNFFLNPTEQERETYDAQRKRLSDKFNELDNEQ
jgi:hypothetical protein